MNWIKNYQLFLFDFDGLLVDTELLHFDAYRQMCLKRGYSLNWNFEKFSLAAHHTATGLKNQIYESLPALQEQEADWSVLYKEKQTIFFNFLKEKQVPLMNGVANILTALDKANIPSCVVTNSPLELTESVKKHQPLLNLIPHWITRENYQQPKPDPECYLYAIDRYASKDCQAVIGFEDSPKGFKALQQSGALPILICPKSSPYLSTLDLNTISYYPSFDEITDKNFP